MKQYYEPRENFALFGGLSLIYGAIFTFCLYKNISGITFPVYVLATIAFAVCVVRYLITQVKVNAHIKRGTVPYFAGMLILGISNVGTTNEFFLLFNWMGMILLFVVSMIHQFYEDQTWNFWGYIKRLTVLFFSSIRNVFAPVRHGAAYLQEKEEGRNKGILYVVLGLVIAFALLVIIFPLLLSSDMIFQSVFQSFLNRIDMVSIVFILGMLIFGTVVSYAFLCGLCRRNLQNITDGKTYHIPAAIGITFTAVIASVYVLYSGIQILYLFIGLERGLPEGVTYSQYAHNGFWQLLFVSLLNFIMVLLCKNLFEGNRILNVCLLVISACTFVMITSAMYRMILYVGEYHLTFLRLLVLWFLVLLAFIMVGTVLFIFRAKFPLFRYCVAVVAVFYMALSLAKVDLRIAQYNVSQDAQITMENLGYLLYGLSDDAAPVIAAIDLDTIAEKDRKGEAQEMMDAYFERVEANYDSSDFRKYNLSKEAAKKAVIAYRRVR